MKALWYDKQGAARDVLELGEMPTPEAGTGEVRVEVRASGINPSDVGLRRGRPGRPMQFPRVIPHSDGAGVVDQVGPDADPAWLGKRVWIYNGARAGRCFGNAADYICLSQDLVYELPARTSFAEGATLGIPAMTAHCCLFSRGPIEGKTVLVTGGAGAVGHYALQLARRGGAAHTIATVSSAKKADIAASGGADHTLNYREEDVAGRLRELTDGRGVDHIVDVDFGGNFDAGIRALALNGSWAAYASSGNRSPTVSIGALMAKNVNLQFLVLNSLPHEVRRAAQREVTALAESDAAIHNIAGRFTLEQSVAAHELVESGEKLGTVVVEHGGSQA
ncbi:MAG: NADPH:quinone reductase [Myxococcales bacterium]|nr:NADPH:quinone reductase [Myxococcales bacterium]